jgi:hypothetical protein
MKQNLFFLIFSLILFLPSAQTKAQENKNVFRDSIDNAVDMSEFLNSVTGFLPTPIIITEPAVGFGGGLFGIYFHKKKKPDGSGKYGMLPPVMSFGGGGVTSNKTWFSILGHQGSYKKDLIRYTGILGYFDVNLGFYGASILEDERKYEFKIKGWAIYQQYMMRVKREVPFFLGANYVYFNNEVSFKTLFENPELSELEKKTSTAGINAAAMWDSRDNTFTPNRGLFVKLEFGRYDDALGGANDYNNFNLNSFFFTNAINRTVAGFRVSSQAKWGDPAFYELPFIVMRGIPAMRYQDNNVSVFETEWRVNVWKRWSLVGFTGVGFTAPTIDSYQWDSAKASVGGGFRYFLAKQYGLHAGIDVARGPEEWAWYIILGSNWFRF